jgi:hypothetical protein
MLLTGAALLRTAAAQAAPAVCGALLSASASARGRRPFAPAASAASAASPHHQQHRTLMWSVEREKGHVYKNPDEIIDDKAITSALESTKERAKDPNAIAAILAAARERAFLTNYTPGERFWFSLAFFGIHPLPPAALSLSHAAPPLALQTEKNTKNTHTKTKKLKN